MKINVAAFTSGLVFALGLGVSGMSRPAKVLAFLNVTGDWDPSLMFVMIGAIAVHALLSRFILRRRRPLLSEAFSLPTRKDIDTPLLVGASLFGVGWGLAGLCPGPAIVGLASMSHIPVVFVVTMSIGMLVGTRVLKRIGRA